MTQKKDSEASQTDFGFEKISPFEKLKRVQTLFNSISKNYDLMNDLMSGGLHRLWKDCFVKKIAPTPAEIILDLAGGTGDISCRLVSHIYTTLKSNAIPGKNLKKTPNVYVCDLSESMVKEGKKKALDKGILHEITWIVGEGERLPFPAQSFDIITISFGLRNVSNRVQVLEEIYRVLKSTGRFYCLEFSKVKNSYLNNLYKAYSFAIIPKIGKIVTNDAPAYQYLVESIEKFPSQEILMQEMCNVGFQNVSYSNLTNGVAAIHYGSKM